MKCKACNKDMGFNDLKYNKYTKDYEELCSNCLDSAFGKEPQTTIYDVFMPLEEYKE